MGRLSKIPTWKLWGISRESYLYYYNKMNTVDYHKMGIYYMTRANKEFADTHKIAEILEHKIYMARISTAKFYELRIDEAKEK